MAGDAVSTAELDTAKACQAALLRVRALRSQIASELAGAAINCGADTDLAADIENLQSWLSDGTGPMHDAIKGADHAACCAYDDMYERICTPHLAAE